MILAALQNELKIKKTADSVRNQPFLWSGLRDSNPRSLEPKSSAIPNFAKPGYSVGDFLDVVKHVVKSHFRPQFLKSQGRKVLEPQRFFGLRIFMETSGRSAPKSSALPTDGNSEYGGYYIWFRWKKQSFFVVLAGCRGNAPEHSGAVSLLPAKTTKEDCFFQRNHI